MKLFSALLLVLLLGSPTAWAAARFALVAGNDQGSTDHPKLWFAESDAVHFASALTDVGEFQTDHVTILKGASAGEFRQAFADIERRIQTERVQGERSLLVVYFSGHATEAGLEFGTDRITYAELRAFLTHAGADARVAVVDACDAGQLTQVKGGHPSSAVTFALPLEDRVEGVAFVASTAVGEPAQESKALAGSFFTRHFEVALRGAGDADGDGQVTLTEAFRYASMRTVAATAGTSAGAQHPTYDVRMSGHGDVVLADLRRAESILALPPAEGAQYVVRGADGVVAEVPGTASSIRLALKAGHYIIERRSEAGTLHVELNLAQGESRDLPPMELLAFADTGRKGMAKGLGLFAGAMVSSGAMLHENLSWGAQVGVSHRIGPIIGRVSFDYSESSVNDSGLSYRLVTLGGSVAALVPILGGDGFRLAGGVELGCAQATQFVEHGLTYGTIDADGGGLLSLTYPVGPIRLGVDSSAAVHAFLLDEAPAYRFTAGCMMTAGVEL